MTRTADGELAAHTSAPWNSLSVVSSVLRVLKRTWISQTLDEVAPVALGSGLLAFLLVRDRAHRADEIESESGTGSCYNETIDHGHEFVTRSSSHI